MEPGHSTFIDVSRRDYGRPSAFLPSCIVVLRAARLCGEDLKIEPKGPGH